MDHLSNILMTDSDPNLNSALNIKEGEEEWTKFLNLMMMM